MGTLPKCGWVLFLGLLSSCAVNEEKADHKQAATTESSPVLKSEFIYETAPFPSCHASSIAETKEGLIATWFGGKHEKSPDVGIWVSRHDGNQWAPPVEVANGKQKEGKQLPTWNPVLHQPRNGPLLLFYKVGPSPSTWWGMMMRSTDAGKTWSEPEKLPYLGPIKNKPVELDDGTLLCGSSTEDSGWRVHMERTPDLGRTWTKTGPLNDGKLYSAIQPAILVHGKGTLQILCRSEQDEITECWSRDNGATWSPMDATTLPNPNSGLDAVTLKDGRHVLIYNHTTKGRTPLNLAVSTDGKTWKPGPVLESHPGEYSYPAIIQTKDGLLHATYTWKRQRIKHVVIDPAKL